MPAPPTVPQLDVFTVKVMTLVTVVIVSLATLVSWRINDRMAGMRSFALGLLSIALGGLLGLGRLAISGNSIVAACNVFMLGGILAVAQGIRSFRSFPPLPKGPLAVSLAIVSAFYAYWLLVHDVFAVRVGIVSVPFSLLCLDSAASMVRKVAVRDRAIYWPAGLAFAFASFYLAVRAWSAFTGPFGTSLLSPGPVEVACTICADISYIACAFGMLLASNRRLRNESEQRALFDPLTNLPNRRLFLDRLFEAELRAEATGRPFGLIYLDLDGFKIVNDTLGHDRGDDLLRNIGSAMTGVLRAGDCLARLGGDEFVVLIENVNDRREVAVLAERLTSVVESQTVPGYSAQPVRMSSGVAIFPEDGRSAHDVMREADLAMYQHKRRRRRMGVAPDPDSAAETTLTERLHSKQA
jgi:diguanylate cyclase (GGDEF)-like protein